MVTVNYYLHYSCINVPNFTNIHTFYTFFHYWLQLQSYLHQVNESTLVRVYMWFIVLVQVHYHIFCLTTNGWIYLFLMNRIWATIQSIEWQLIERFAVMRWCVSTKKKIYNDGQIPSNKWWQWMNVATSSLSVTNGRFPWQTSHIVDY